MRAIIVALILAAFLALAGCAHKPGLGSAADSATTYVALSSGEFVEANPLFTGLSPAATALTLLAAKQGMKYGLTAAGIEHDDAHRAIETGGMAGAGWNLAMMAGASGIVPLVGGLGAALWYWAWSGDRLP